jgi:hypothetical protein
MYRIDKKRKSLLLLYPAEPILIPGLAAPVLSSAGLV